MKSMSASKKYNLLIVFLCLILCVSFFFLLYRFLRSQTYKTVNDPKWVYVYLSQEEESLSTESDSASHGWILRSYQGRIGIFHEDGGLADILDIQIKTLPKADRLLLEEGIYAKDRDTLDALIQDYSE